MVSIEPIKNQYLTALKERQQIGARQCKVQAISRQEANDFCNMYHYQNQTYTLCCHLRFLIHNSCFLCKLSSNFLHQKNLEYQSLI